MDRHNTETRLSPAARSICRKGAACGDPAPPGDGSTGSHAVAQLVLTDMRRYLMIVLRLLLGGVLLYAAYMKLRDPWEVFAMSIAAYGLLPEWAVLAGARTLPWLEAVLGVLVIGGYALRYTSVAITGLLGAFFAVMLFSFAKGLGIDCGCFGPGDTLGRRTLLRDGVLLAASILLTVLCLRTRPKAEKDIANIEPATTKETFR